MDESITQEHGLGCGVACIAFVTKLPYRQVVALMGALEARTKGFSPKRMNAALEALNYAYTRNYLNPQLVPLINREGVIVFIKRSARHPKGHYLVHHRGQWMDPWINFLADIRDISSAQSGYHAKLPGTPIYALFPKE